MIFFQDKKEKEKDEKDKKGGKGEVGGVSLSICPGKDERGESLFRAILRTSDFDGNYCVPKHRFKYAFDFFLFLL